MKWQLSIVCLSDKVGGTVIHYYHYFPIVTLLSLSTTLGLSCYIKNIGEITMKFGTLKGKTLCPLH